ncbi:plexin-A2-like [Planococcus citri]|uniref:plexin-A2-like n=1 Tax=Planococcus citri TaxID=170843 RepID=UPI0031F90331
MANLQILFRMNRDAVCASWLVLILCILQKNVTYSEFEDNGLYQIFMEERDSTTFNHLVMDETKGLVFIGAVDVLYQLSFDLRLVASLRQNNSSPKCDDFKDVSNGVKKSIANSNKILFLDHYNSELTSCWSTCYGLCKIYSVGVPLREVSTVTRPIVSRDENASTVAITYASSEVTTLLVGVTITTSESVVPALSRMMRKFGNEFLPSYDLITLRNDYKGKYIINYIYGFSSGGFDYFLTTQMNSTQPSLYISKLVRVSVETMFQNSYMEIPIECFDEKERKYNLAQAAFVGKPGSELADSLGITPRDKVLFGAFAQSEKQIVGYESSIPSNRSALCIYSLKEIKHKFNENIQRCKNGTGYRGLEFINPPDQKCKEENEPIDSKSYGKNLKMPLEGYSPVKTRVSIIFDTLVTAVRAEPHPRNDTAVFVGTNTGHLKQIVVENKFNAHECTDIAIDEGFAINSDLYFESRMDHLYIMTERKLTKMEVSLAPSISSFKPTLGILGEIINVTIQGNNYLACSLNNSQHSIAVAGIPCTTYRPPHSAEIVCTIDTHSINLTDREEYEGPVEIQVHGIIIVSKQNFGIFHPKIESINPTRGSFYGGNKLIIKGKNFKANSSVNVYIGNVSCSVLHHDENEITCITGPSSVLESKIAIKFDDNFRIFDFIYKYFDTDLDEKGHNLTLKGIPAGGITIYMDNNLGLNKTSIGKLFLQVNSHGQTYNSTICEVENSTTFNCLSPHMPEIDSHSIDVKNPQVFNYTLMVLLNRTNAGDPLSIKSSKFFVYPNPVFEHYSVTELDDNIRFVIKGRNIDNVCRIDDFIVRVEDENCKIFIISRSDLTCQVQKSALKHNYYKNTTEQDFSTAYGNVTVQIGNYSKQVVPYFNTVPIVSTEKLWSDWIIYGVCFGALIFIVIVFILIKLLIAYREKSFKSLKMSREMQKQINKMGMDAIAMRQCIKKIVVEKKINVDGSLANILKLPNITIEYTPVPKTDVETSPEMEFYLLPLDTKWEFPREKLFLGRFLGEGEFGKVVQGEALGIVDENITTTVAVKMLKVKHSDADMIDLVSEMEIMKLIGMHPNVLRLLGCCTQNGPLLIITEYALHGNLQSFLHKHVASENFETAPSELSQRTLVTFCLQVARGMEYLSSKKCVHRDLAARNILVSDYHILKIADFGLARDIKNKDYYRKKSGGRLPVKWMAPEALLRKLYTVQSDVWSYGILLWEIMTLGGSPYPTFTDMKKLLRDLHSGYRMEKPPDCSVEMYSIMRQCWNYIPKDRPSFSVIVENLEEILLQSSGDDEILEKPDLYESSSIDSECSESDNEALEGDHLLSITP